MRRNQFLGVFALVTAITLLWLWVWWDFHRAVDDHRAQYASELTNGLNGALDSYRQLVDLAHQSLLLHHPQLPQWLHDAGNADPPQQARIRGLIYRTLHPDFAHLRQRDIRGLQVTLADGRSFLRFHRPDLYADLITQDSPLLARVLARGEPDWAFENSRVYPGFRYAFPVSYGGQVVATLDFLVSYEAVRWLLERSSTIVGSASRVILRRDLLQAVTHPSALQLFHPTAFGPGYLEEDENSPVRDITRATPLPPWIEQVDQNLSRDPVFMAALAAGKAAQRLLCPDGESCYAAVLHPLQDSHGRAAAFALVYAPETRYPWLRWHALGLFAVGSAILILSGFALRRWLRSQQRLRTISDNMGEGLYVTDTRGRIIHSNPAAHELLGYTERELKGRRAHSLFHVHSSGLPLTEDECPIRSEALAGRAYHSETETFRSQDGRILQVSVVSSPLLEEGLVRGVVVLFRDTTADFAYRCRLRQTDMALRHMAEGVMITDPDNRIVAINRAFTEITGYGEEEVLGREPSLLSSGRQDVAFYHDLWRHLQDHGAWEGELWNRRKDGSLYRERLRVSALPDDDGQVTGYVGVFSDVTELRENQERLQYLAYQDPLTGLYNRTAFGELFNHALHRARRGNGRLALLYLDVDRFKRINDSLGHRVGDELLKEIAGRLVRTVREADEVARLGGDEFVVLLEDVIGSNAPAQVARKLLETLRRPVRVGNRTLFATSSIGIALFPEDGRDSTTLLKNADSAMYLAKSEGRDTYRYFTATMAERSRERFQLEGDLRRALAEDGLTLYFQPKVELPTGRVVGVEALVRWHHPTRGLLTPDRFLGVAQEAGLMDALTHSVLHQAGRYCAAWRRHGHAGTRVAVNLEAEFFKQAEVEVLLQRLLMDEGIEPRDLELEIVETAFLDDSHHDDLWQRLVEDGFEISIDDFGTGESSLARLKQIPVGTLKIDRSFVRDIESDENDRAIVRTVIAMARNLGKRVIAEGVETEAQLRFLYAAGCDTIQGYYFSRPVPADRMLELLNPDHFAALARAALTGLHADSGAVAGADRRDLDDGVSMSPPVPHGPG